MKKWITAAALAEELGISVKLVYSMVQRGEIPSYKVGRNYRFVLKEVVRSLRQPARAPEKRSPDVRDQKRRPLASVVPVQVPDDGGAQAIPAVDWSKRQQG